MTEDCSHLIERIPALESRLGVELRGLYARWDEDTGFVWINGELVSPYGPDLEADTVITAAAYDEHGRVIETAEHVVSQANFFQFDVFQLQLSVPGQPDRVRIFPKKL